MIPQRRYYTRDFEFFNNPKKDDDSEEDDPYDNYSRLKKLPRLLSAKRRMEILDRLSSYWQGVK